MEWLNSKIFGRLQRKIGEIYFVAQLQDESRFNSYIKQDFETSL